MAKKKLKNMEKGKKKDKKKKSWFNIVPAGHIEKLLKRNKKMKTLLDALK